MILLQQQHAPKIHFWFKGHRTCSNLKVIIFLGLPVPFCLPPSNTAAWKIVRLWVPFATFRCHNSLEKPSESDRMFSCFSFLLKQRSPPCLSLSLIHKPCPDVCFGSKMDVSMMSKINRQQSRVLAQTLGLSSHILSSILLNCRYSRPSACSPTMRNRQAAIWL